MSGKPAKKRGTSKKSKQTPGGSPEARRRVSAVLEVLAGALSPSEAAEVLGCSSTRYYGIEAKALDGMVSACEPRPAGRTRTPERELAALQQAYAKLERECARYKALCRVAQRTAGLSATKVKQAKARPGKRKRKPTVRALKLSQRLQEGAEPAATESEEEGDGTGKKA